MSIVPLPGRNHLFLESELAFGQFLDQTRAFLAARHEIALTSISAKVLPRTAPVLAQGKEPREDPVQVRTRDWKSSALRRRAPTQFL
jgi:hypothetical protein